MQEMQVQSSGQEDTLEKGMTIHSSTLAWKTPGQRSQQAPGGCKESDMAEVTEQELQNKVATCKTSFSLHLFWPHQAVCAILSSLTS